MSIPEREPILCSRCQHDAEEHVYFNMCYGTEDEVCDCDKSDRDVYEAEIEKLRKQR